MIRFSLSLSLSLFSFFLSLSHTHTLSLLSVCVLMNETNALFIRYSLLLADYKQANHQGHRNRLTTVHKSSSEKIELQQTYMKIKRYSK